jgi:hypothetical protein
VEPIDVQRAGPIRPWLARVGSGRPAMGLYGLRATRARPPTGSGRALGPWLGPRVILSAHGSLGPHLTGPRASPPSIKTNPRSI